MIYSMCRASMQLTCIRTEPSVACPQVRVRRAHRQLPPPIRPMLSVERVDISDIEMAVYK